MVRNLAVAVEHDVGRRARSRLRTRLPARIVTLYGTRNTLLLDLSLTGARIKADADMSCGQTIVLEVALFEAFGKIVWIAGGSCGVSFDEPISSKLLLAMRVRDETDRLPSDSDLARKLAGEWVAGQRRI